MKTDILLITALTLVKFNNAFNDRFVLERFGLQEYYNINLSSVDISKECDDNQKCIWKCCPERQAMGRFKTCNVSNTGISNVTVFDQSHLKTNKSLNSTFKLVPNLMQNEKFARNALWWYKAYLTEDGSLFFKMPNVYNRWKEIQTDHFCVEWNVYENKPVFMAEYEIDHPRNPSVYKKWSLILSTICLVFIFIVYAIVQELKDLNGIILMMHFGCLIFTFITHSILESFNSMTLLMSEILLLTFFHYFFKMASFAWTNVMFYCLLVSSYRTKDGKVSLAKQLLKYCAYSFGLSLFLTILTATVELSDMTDTPSLVTPQIQNRGNFTFHEMESLYYLYYPLLVILAFNWIVCFIKLIEFCKTAKHFSAVAGHNDDQEVSFNRPVQFVKLLALLSVYALGEMLTVIYLKGNHDSSSMYSLCVGPIILVIFLWNKNVHKAMSESYKTYKRRASDSNHLVSFFHKNDQTT